MRVLGPTSLSTSRCFLGWCARPTRCGRTVREQLDASGYDHDRLLGVLVTHSHWDHVSGLDEVRWPVWINRAELRYAAEDPDGKVFRHLSPGLDIHEYGFDGPAYLGFPASFDVHGDGSVVVALAGGHTPGSVVVFVTLPSGARYAFIGDLTWQLDGIRPSGRAAVVVTQARRQRCRAGAPGAFSA